MVPRDELIAALRILAREMSDDRRTLRERRVRIRKCLRTMTAEEIEAIGLLVIFAAKQLRR